jgi:hypothetical protein
MEVYIHTVPYSTVQILFAIESLFSALIANQNQPDEYLHLFQGAGTKHVATGKLWHKHCMLQSMPPAIALNLETSWPAHS